MLVWMEICVQLRRGLECLIERLPGLSLTMYSSIWILAMVVCLNLPSALGSPAATSLPAIPARRLLFNSSASNTSTIPPSTTPSSVTDSCSALSACNSSVLPYNRTLTIVVVGIFVACIVLALVSVYARRFCVTEANLYVRYQSMERSGENRGNAALVKTLPVVTYEVLVEDSKQTARECAVCLGAFQRGEMVRVLPVCDHPFHKDCVDMWLFSHTTCPLCRVSVLKLNKGSPLSSA